MTIKELRESKGLKQGKFADSIGVTRTAIIGYEKGKFQPSAAVVAKIKEVYGVDITMEEGAAQPKKRGGRKKKDEQTAVEEAPAAAAPAVDEQPAAQPKKRSGRKKVAAAAPAVDEQPATAPVVEEQPAAAPKKRGGRKKAAAPAAEEKRPVEEKKPVKEKKPAKRGKKAEDGPRVIIQSPMGGSITPEEILRKIGEVDAVYVRVDENKAYWVRGDETGSIDLWV